MPSTERSLRSLDDGKKSQKAEKKAKERDPLDWEDAHFPPMAEREVVQAKLDPHVLEDMRDRAKAKMLERMGQDPAEVDRKWNFHFAITGIENTTTSDWDVFVAATMASDKQAKKNRLHGDYLYTKSYTVKAGSTKVLKSIEALYNMPLTLSYKELVRNEISMDVWLVCRNNFNQILGTATKSLYAMANESVFQSISIKPNRDGDTRSFDIGAIHVNAVVSEVMQFDIVLSNWQFQPRPEFNDYSAEKSLRVTIPGGAEKEAQEFRTAICKGPRYCWMNAGQYTYTGTKVSLSMEAMAISVYSGGALQGKAVLSLGVAGEYPIAMGTVKAMTKNVNHFVVGRLGGSLTVTSKSLLVDRKVHDEESTIPTPLQPADSLVLFHLDPNQQYLVVEVQGAEGLPIADSDYGSSNPLVRVKFDSMVQQSPCISGTLNPTWGHTFFLPVRMTDEQIRSNKDFYQTLLPEEMRSKGFLELEVWHFDGVPVEFLGALKLDLHKVRFGQQRPRAICQTVIKARKPTSSSSGEAAEDEEEDAGIGIHPALAKKHSTKVYEGRRQKLIGSWLQSVTRPTISFECYFIPDFAGDFTYPEQPQSEEDVLELVQASVKSFDESWTLFNEAYTAWFPDAPAGRRWLSNFHHASGEQLVLPLLITPLALPASLASPMQILHWIRCMEFTAPARQRSCGQMTIWQKPQDMLSLRRGSVQDHAVLLCCALLGLGKNAFVCKGTVQSGLEHCWVMSREQGGVVTFWEPTTGAKFHLPNRWLADTSHSEATQQKASQRWQARDVNWGWMELASQRQAMGRTEHLEKMEDLLRLPISAWPELFITRENLVALPYESLEVVFNGQQLWGNLCNHHPSCIMFDMEDDPQSWRPLLAPEVAAKLHAGRAVAIPVGPAISRYTANNLQDSVESEIKESIRMIRIRKGHESVYADEEVLQEALESYLQHLEDECRLDSDWCSTPKEELVKPWGAQSPFNSVAYVQQCQEAWAKHWKMKEALRQGRAYLAVRENHVLSGIALHFSTTDLKVIRQGIMRCHPIQEYFNLPMDDILFFICCKVFPLPSSVASVWIFLGAEVPLSKEQIREQVEEDMRRARDAARSRS